MCCNSRWRSETGVIGQRARTILQLSLSSSYSPMHVFNFAASLNTHKKTVFLCVILPKNSILQFLAMFALDKRIGSKPSWLLMNL